MWIRIKGIRLFGYHGVFDYEKKLGSNFEFDVEVMTSNDKISDRLSDTIDYTILIDIVKRVNDSRSYDIIEALATDIIDAITNETEGRVSESIVRVRKYALPIEAELSYVEAEARKIQ